MAVAVTASPTEPKADESTVTLSYTGLTTSTTYWLLINPGPTAITLSGSLVDWQGLTSGAGEVYIQEFATGAGTTWSPTWVPPYAGTWQYQLILAPTFSSVASSTGSFSAIGAG